MVAFFQRHLSLILKIIKGVVTLLFIIILIRSIDSLSSLKESFSLSLLGSALLFSILMQLVQIYRWQIALKLRGFTYALPQIAKSYFIGTLFAIVSPGRVGELLRFTSLHNLSKKEGLLALVTDRLILMATLALVGAFSLMGWTFIPINYGMYGVVSPVVVRSGVLFSGLIALIGLSGYWIKQRDKRWSMLLIISSFVVNTILIIQIAYLLQGLIALPLHQGFGIAAGAFLLLQLLPISVSNVGTRELLLTYFYWQYLGPQGEVALVVPQFITLSLIVMAVNLVFPALVGSLYILNDSFKRSDKE